jgi:hypothetical protein
MFFHIHRLKYEQDLFYLFGSTEKSLPHLFQKISSQHLAYLALYLYPLGFIVLLSILHNHNDHLLLDLSSLLRDHKTDECQASISREFDKSYGVFFTFSDDDSYIVQLCVFLRR